MDDDTIKPIARLLKDRACVAKRLVEQAARLESLAKLIRLELDPLLAEHFWVASFDGEHLWLHADSPAWAARLRYQAVTLIESLKKRQDMAGLCSIQVRVRPWSPPSSSPLTKPVSGTRRPHLSAQAGNVIRAAALACQHPELQQALLRLAQRAKGGERAS
jgi:hypothetical protein